jgi:putative ABC transport system ATP-binding protein
VLLADEPTGNLDSKRGKEVMDLLSELNKKEGKTIILVTHDENLAKHAERIVHLKDGLIEKGGRK